MLIKGASQVPGGFGNRKYFLVLRHSTKNMLLTAEMPFKRVCRNGRRAQGERVLFSERAGGNMLKVRILSLSFCKSTPAVMGQAL